MYPSNHPLPVSDHSTTVPKVFNFAYSMRDSRDQLDDLQSQGIQHVSESTGNKFIDLGWDNPTGSPNSANTFQAMQVQGRFGQRLTESTRKTKKRRTQFTLSQLGKLEAAFSQSQYITPPMRQSLSQELGLSEGSVKNWFKNRRVKWRREQCQYMRPVSLAPVPYVQCFGHVPYPYSTMMIIHPGYSVEHNLHKPANTAASVQTKTADIRILVLPNRRSNSTKKLSDLQEISDDEYDDDDDDDEYECDDDDVVDDDDDDEYDDDVVDDDDDECDDDVVDDDDDECDDDVDDDDVDDDDDDDDDEEAWKAIVIIIN
ncbi:hypothetical protein ACROYT_G020722 [Oculina patagonica]